MKERLWKKDCEQKIVKKRLWIKDCGKKIVKERLWKKHCERKTMKREFLKGRLKDRFRVKDWKRKPAEMWKVILDHFPPFLPSQNKRVKDGWTNGRTNDQQTDQRTDRPSYRDARTHLKMREKGQKWVSTSLQAFSFNLSL